MSAPQFASSQPPSEEIVCRLLESAPNLAAAFFSFADLTPQAPVYRQPTLDPARPLSEEPRRWSGAEYQLVSRRVLTVASYLRGLGLKRGDKVAILSNSRPEWMIADLAVLALGGVVVSIYQSVNASDVGYILYDSGAQFIFAENQEQVDKLCELVSKPVTIPATEERDGTTVQLGLKRIIAFESVSAHPLTTQFGQIDSLPLKVEELALSEIERANLATLVYTSGTTGPPKGVMQSHANHLANVRQAYSSGLFGMSSTLMLVLPLAHSFAKLVGYLGFLTPCVICFPAVADPRSSKPNPESVTKDLREANAEIVPVVPRLLEKMQSGIQAKAHGSGIGATIVATTVGCARAVYRGDASLAQRIGFVATTPIRRKIARKLFGDNLRYLVSGGAKLAVSTAEFFDALGVEILEGYGLTETCVATNVNRLGRKKIGTVGPVLATDIQLRIGSDGEILFKGPNVTSGYYNRPKATAASWDSEGWFHTGDLGSVDGDGFLKIEGRKKEIIVTSTGKKIAPEGIEQQLKRSPFLSQVLLYGDDRSYCVALVTLNTEAVRGWALHNGVSPTIADLTTEPRVRELIASHIEKVNKSLANYEAVRNFTILAEDFSIENGLLTPTFKTKRKAIVKRYAEVIEKLYAEKVRGEG